MAASVARVRSLNCARRVESATSPVGAHTPSKPSPRAVNLVTRARAHMAAPLNAVSTAGATVAVADRERIHTSSPHTSDPHTSDPEPGHMPEKKKVAGSTVVITGGSQGVGRALARMYAQRGNNVVVMARQEERLNAVAEECRRLSSRPEGVLAVAGDVADPAAIQNLLKKVSDTFERVDIVINNAGVCATGLLQDMPEQDIARIMAVNFTGPALVARAFTPLLIKAAKDQKEEWRRQKGAPPRPTLVCVNSFAARIPIRGMSVYTASKQALAGLVDCLRYELQPSGVDVVQVHPGVIKSDFLERATFYGESADKARSSLKMTLSSGAAQSPEEVAKAVVSAVDGGEKEVVVGPVFQAAIAAYKATGLNLFSVARS